MVAMLGAVAVSAGAQRGGPPAPAGPREKLDSVALAKIRDEGFNRSKIMETSSWLTDVYGPRLTGSPNMRKAADWTQKAMTSWGISNVHTEAWGPFGHGWQNEGFTAQVVSPQAYPIVAYPTPWSFGTNGLASGDVVLNVRIDSAADFAKYKGKLKGKWIMADQPANVPPKFAAIACRLNGPQLWMDVDLQREVNCRTPADSQRAAIDRQQMNALMGITPGGRGGRGGGGGGGGGRGGGGGQSFAQQLTDFYVSEGVLGILHTGSGSYTDFVLSVGGGRGPAEIPKTGYANINIAADHYGRIYRTAEKGIPVRLEINAKNTFSPDTGSFNIIGEIPGTDPTLKSELVMLGGHFDSWAAGTGATDNAAGSAVMLEAVRILKTLNLPMKRTVRIALWTGEEQGLLGSRAYVRQHFGFVDSVGQHFTPDHAKLAGYFNVDNGSGAIRGVYVEHNDSIVSVFKQWLVPFADLGATTVTLAPTTGTDHQSYDAIGLPGFQFIQDDLDYINHTHHTNADMYERLVPKDMMQNAVIVASFVYNTANRDQQLPRKPAPLRSGGGRGRGAQ
jgi:hypothetical protein